jgi:putative endopeptidase
MTINAKSMKIHQICAAIMLAGAAAAIAGCTGKTKTPAIDLANLDTATAPGTDFYQYATGGWQKNNPLKPEYSRYGSFDILGENNQIRVNDLFKGLAGTKAP